MSDVIRLKMDCHQKFVLLMLANYCDAEGGSCFPSVARLAADTGMSDSSVKRALRRLRDYSGLIQVTPGGGARSNRYQLATALIAQLGASATQVTLTQVKTDPGQPDPPPRSDRPPTPVTLTHDPIKEPTKEPTTVGGATNRRPVLQEPTAKHRLAAKTKGVDCDAEWQRYVNWLAANGRVHKDRSAGFSNWLDLARPQLVRPVGAKTQADRRVETNAAIWGVRNEPEPTDITGQSERVA